MSTKYIVRFSVDGEAEFTADSREEAQEMFERMSASDLIDNAALIADEPKTEVEIKQEDDDFAAQFRAMNRV